MHIYKFRFLSDINGDFTRDVEIQATQTFEDLHNVISNTVNLNGNELASFHICDQNWNKKKEITLIDMLNGDSIINEEEETEPIEEIYIMKSSLIKDFIEDPHQRLLYEYDFLNIKTFFVELLSVHRQNGTEEYPRCTFSRGDLVETVIPELVDEGDSDLTEQLLNDFSNLLDDTFEYKGDDDDTEL